jgi:hypothetical protein
LPYDTVVEVSSGRIPVDSFCVEKGRWSERKGESARGFSSSLFSLSTSELRRAAAAPSEASQEMVWQNVAATQERLGRKIGATVRSNASVSSLQLTLENQAVTDALKPYVDALDPAPGSAGDAIGCVVAVNGRAITADVYASPTLFRKLWPKLLRGSAVEAVLETAPGRTVEPVTEDAVRAFLGNAENGTPTADVSTARTYVLTRRSGNQLVIDSCDRSHDNVVLHRSILARIDD